jgi:hypothetical protein
MHETFSEFEIVYSIKEYKNVIGEWGKNENITRNV